VGKCSEVKCDYVGVWCVPSATHMLQCTQRSQNTVTDIGVLVTLLFKLPHMLSLFSTPTKSLLLIELQCTVSCLSSQVVLVDARSHSYVREGSHCEFLLTSFDSSWGVLENPRHSLPPNTTCRYHFQGRRHETVWLSFVKYHAASADPAAYEQGTECNARLRIWDGRLATSSGSPRQQVS